MKRFISKLALATLGIFALVSAAQGQTPKPPGTGPFDFKPRTASFAPPGFTLTPPSAKPAPELPKDRPASLLPPLFGAKDRVLTSKESSTLPGDTPATLPIMGPGVRIVFYQRYEDSKGKRYDIYATVVAPMAMREKVIQQYESRRYSMHSIRVYK